MENKYKYQEAYESKNNIAAKTYKLNRDVAERFRDACQERCTSQAKELTRMMLEYIAKTE